MEIDEAYLGGKKTRKGVKAGKDAKIAILGIAERGGRDHMRRIPNAKAATLKPVLQAKVSLNAKQVITDGHPTYVNIIPSIVPVSQHKVADHKKELDEFGELSAKTVEGAFSLFKRGVVGSYHHLSEDHLDSYLQEFCWRYNRRKLQPFMFNTLLTELTQKKRLTYRKPTREVF